MNLFRLFLVVIMVGVAFYTAIVVANYGMGPAAVFFSDISELNWHGQFNLDFLGYLLLSGFWIAWRSEFSAIGLLLGLGGVFLGAPYLCGYLLVESLNTRGDAAALLLGKRRAARLRSGD